jgi:hypothetical protein
MHFIRSNCAPKRQGLVATPEPCSFIGGKSLSFQAIAPLCCLNIICLLSKNMSHCRVEEAYQFRMGKSHEYLESSQNLSCFL